MEGGRDSHTQKKRKSEEKKYVRVQGEVSTDQVPLDVQFLIGEPYHPDGQTPWTPIEGAVTEE